MANTISYTTKGVIFYEIIYKTHDEYEVNNKYNTLFQNLFGEVVKLVKAKDPSRYQYTSEKALFINDIIFDPQPQRSVVKGKLLCVRKDIFPEIINTETDITRPIDALEQEGVVETTHFIIFEKNNNKTNKVSICLESNLFGAKINDFIFYITRLGVQLKIIEAASFMPITRNTLTKMKKKIGGISKITIRVREDNIPILNNIDTGVASLFKRASKEFEQEYLTIELKYNIHEARENPTISKAVKAKTLVGKFIQHLLDNKKDINNFDTLEIVAENEERNNKLEAFDLLVDHLKDRVKVEKKAKSKVIVSVDMFDKMETSIMQNRL